MVELDTVKVKEEQRLLEKDVEKELRERTKQMGGKAYKFVSPGNSGVPDRIVVLPGGRIAFVELKRPGGEARGLQKIQMQFLESMGFRTAVIDSKEQVIPFLTSLL